METVQQEPIVTIPVMLTQTKTMFVITMKTATEMETGTDRRCSEGEMAPAVTMLLSGEVMVAAEVGNCKRIKLVK